MLTIWVRQQTNCKFHKKRCHREITGKSGTKKTGSKIAELQKQFEQNLQKTQEKREKMKPEDYLVDKDVEAEHYPAKPLIGKKPAYMAELENKFKNKE